MAILKHEPVIGA